MSEELSEREKAQRDAQWHSQNLSQAGAGEGQTPETLKYISEPEESVSSPTEALNWINSKSASTANLSSEDIRSKDWILEYHQLLSRMEHPPVYGLKGHLRAWAYDDVSEYREPLNSSKLLQTEGYTEIGKEATTRSREGWGVETSTSHTSESIVRNNETKSGGILGRIRNR